MCNIWADGVLHPRERKEESVEEEKDTKDECLHNYTLVIPIILRFVKEQKTIEDIFASQLQCLNVCEIAALTKYQETNPDKVLLLLDGFDEYRGRSTVDKVIRKMESPEVLCITTSRPHAIEQLTKDTSQAVDQHVRLCGFSDEQVKLYIEQFFVYHKLPRENGEKLKETLFEEE